MKKISKSKKSFVVVIPLEKAKKILQERIEAGQLLLKSTINDISQWKNAEKKFNLWNSENYDLLKKIFYRNTVAKEYSSSEWSIGRIFISGLKLEEKKSKLQSDIEEKINKINSIYTSLGVFESPADKNKQVSQNKVFFIHGSDCETKVKVIDFINSIGLEPIILKDLAGAGKTLIDEIQENSDVKYAIVLLTPDNVGGVYSENLQFRATQNIILELGIFIGLLGRQNVSALHTEDIELPADYHGFEYIKIFSNDGWKIILAKELKEAGFNIDLNKI